MESKLGFHSERCLPSTGTAGTNRVSKVTGLPDERAQKASEPLYKVGGLTGSIQISADDSRRSLW